MIISPQLHERILRYIAPVTFGLLLLFLWQWVCVAAHVPAYLVPTPLGIAAQFIVSAPVLLAALWVTFKVTVFAFLLAVFLGVAVALLMVQHKVIENCLMPYAILFQVTPVVAIAPLIIIWIKNTSFALVVCAMMVCIFPIISNTMLGLRSVPKGLTDVFKVLNASKLQVLLRLRIPAALPYFLGGMRISSGLALIGAVVAEFVAGSSGAGAGLAYQILQAGLQLNIPLMFAALFLIAMLGIGQYGFMVWLSKVILNRWNDGEKS